MLIVMVIAGLLCALAFLVKNYLIVFAVVIIIIVAISFIIYPKLQRAADKTYNEGC